MIEGRGSVSSGKRTLRQRATFRKPAIVTRRISSLIIRSAIIAIMAFAVAFGFLAGATSPAAHYDPYMFAIGVASLFGAACGAMGILISRIRQMKFVSSGVSMRPPTVIGKYAKRRSAPPAFSRRKTT
jgi:hypothetical protein